MKLTFFFSKDFVDGVTSVMTKPVSSAKQRDASGFAKGLGKGFPGLVTRPTDGIVDFASTSLDITKRYERIDFHRIDFHLELHNKKKLFVVFVISTSCWS